VRRIAPSPFSKLGRGALIGNGIMKKEERNKKLKRNIRVDNYNTKKLKLASSNA
jgi:hypothetical protein